MKKDGLQIKLKPIAQIDLLYGFKSYFLANIPVIIVWESCP